MYSGFISILHSKESCTEKAFLLLVAMVTMRAEQLAYRMSFLAAKMNYSGGRFDVCVQNSAAFICVISYKMKQCVNSYIFTPIGSSSTDSMRTRPHLVTNTRCRMSPALAVSE